MLSRYHWFDWSEFYCQLKIMFAVRRVSENLTKILHYTKKESSCAQTFPLIQPYRKKYLLSKFHQKWEQHHQMKWFSKYGLPFTLWILFKHNNLSTFFSFSVTTINLHKYTRKYSSNFFCKTYRFWIFRHKKKNNSQ